MERQLLKDYMALIDQVLPLATADNTQLMNELMGLPMSMRGFGHVKNRNVSAAQTRKAWLLHRLNPSRYAKPQDSEGMHLRGISIRSI